MKLRDKVNLMFAALLVTSIYAKAQQFVDMSQFEVSSPSMASIKQYHEYPVNYHTGLPDINIPLHSIQEGPISIPISLSYHASGLKVDAPSSWVGAGWTLNAGGAITRTVVGQPDEVFGGIQGFGHFRDYGYDSYLQWKNVADPGMATITTDVASGLADTQPDIFYYSLPGGGSGKFMFDEDRNPIFFPEGDLHIEVNSALTEWTVTTPKGLRYYFGQSNRREETDLFMPNNGLNQSATSSWLLTKIETLDQQFTVNFTYVAESYGYYSPTTNPLQIGQFNNTPYEEQKMVKNIYQGFRLSSISWSTGSIDFILGDVREDLSSANATWVDALNTSARALGKVEINGSQGFCKSFSFSYDYFNDPSTPFKLANTWNNQLTNYFTDKKRLYLQSLQEHSGEPTPILTIPEYDFTYYTPGLVPRRLSLNKDHWGYANGADNNRLMPTVWLGDSEYAGADRSSSFADMLAGSLQEIKYPSGGFTEFLYEANDIFVSGSSNEEQIVKALTCGVSGDLLCTTQSFSVSSGDYFLNASVSLNSPEEYVFRIRDASNNSIILTRTLDPGVSLPEESIQLSSGSYSLEVETFQSHSGSYGSMSVSHIVDVPYAENRLVGGLRVKEIVTESQEALSPLESRTFNYYDVNGRSTGILFSKPVHIANIRNDWLAEVGMRDASGDLTPGYLSGCLTITGNTTLISPQSLWPERQSLGNHIGYEVVKINHNNSDHLGYSTYEYEVGTSFGSTQENVAVIEEKENTLVPCDLTMSNYPPAPLSFEPELGKINEIRHYRVDNENTDLIEKIVYNYVFDPSSSTVKGIMSSSAWNNTSLFTFYNLSTKKLTQSSEIKVLNNGHNGTQIETTTHYNSANHTFPSSTENLINAGVAKTNYMYSADLIKPLCASTNCETTLQSGLSSCQSTFNSAVSAGNCHFATNCWLQAYQALYECKRQAEAGYITCKVQERADYEVCISNMYSSSGNELKTLLKSELNHQNKLIETTSWLDADLLGAEYYSYIDLDAPLGGSNYEVYPFKQKSIDIADPLPASSFDVVAVTSGNLVSDTKYQDNVEYEHAGGRVVEVTGRDGVKKVFLWGFGNNLLIATIANASYDEVRVTLNTHNIFSWSSLNATETENLGAVLRNNLNDARTTTYIHDPLVGVVKVIDENGLQRLYEYDELGRLVNIRDNDQNLTSAYEYHFANTND
ncbi:MAG: hypothetical protein AAGF85_17100 [Bacteroidota bacterium]